MIWRYFLTPREVLFPVYECQDCIGTKDHGCWCQYHECFYPDSNDVPWWAVIGRQVYWFIYVRRSTRWLRDPINRPEGEWTAEEFDAMALENSVTMSKLWRPLRWPFLRNTRQRWAA